MKSTKILKGMPEFLNLSRDQTMPSDNESPLYLMMNLELRLNQKMSLGVEIELGGHKHFITAERQQILDLLISTYEQAVHVNTELKQREKELAHSNQVLQGLNRIAEGLNSAVSEKAVAEMALPAIATARATNIIRRRPKASPSRP